MCTCAYMCVNIYVHDIYIYTHTDIYVYNTSILYIIYIYIYVCVYLSRSVKTSENSGVPTF